MDIYVSCTEQQLYFLPQASCRTSHSCMHENVISPLEDVHLQPFFFRFTQASYINKHLNSLFQYMNAGASNSYLHIQTLVHISSKSSHPLLITLTFIIYLGHADLPYCSIQIQPHRFTCHIHHWRFIFTEFQLHRVKI